MSLFLLVMAAAAQASAAPAEPLTIRANPARVCAAERSPAYHNIDFLVRNDGKEGAKITELRALAENRAGELIEQRLVWQQATGLLNGGGDVPAGSEVTIFNPIGFSSPKDISRVRYEFDVAGRKGPVTVAVTPVDCAPRQPSLSPVAGRLLIYDGHDVLSHHRRGEYLDSWSKKMGITDNFQRFGVDFVVIDKAGKPYRGAGTRTSDWHGWGQPVRAVGDGVVAALHDGQPDNVVIWTVDKWTERTSAENMMSSYGNYVLIEHGPGEFSVVAHLKQGSVKVKRGDKVRAGQVIGAVGNSGASGAVHVHFERRTGGGISGMETLPAYFRDVTLANGNVAAPERGLVLDTGDVVEAR